jgi:hypothetical protein
MNTSKSRVPPGSDCTPGENPYQAASSRSSSDSRRSATSSVSLRPAVNDCFGPRYDVAQIFATGLVYSKWPAAPRLREGPTIAESGLYA